MFLNPEIVIYLWFLPIFIFFVFPVSYLLALWLGRKILAVKDKFVEKITYDLDITNRRALCCWAGNEESQVFVS